MIIFISMKINKLLLRLFHFFRLRLDEEHQDDITMNIPTVYPDTCDNKCESKKAKIVMDDIMDQIYSRFKSDKIFEKRCRNVKQVWITYYKYLDKSTGSIITMIPYVDGILYNPFEKGVRELLNRNQKIEDLLK